MRSKVVVFTLVVLALAGVLFACNQTPTPVPVRTFERAQKVDFVCLKLAQDVGGGTLQVIAPEGRPLSECTPTPPETEGAAFANQLFALVTQTARGEVAVVNLSSGVISDVSERVPSANFLPVGAIPTDIASTPDGRMTFVASAEPNKAAIYGMPSRRILGDKGFVRGFDEQGNTFDVPLPADPEGVPKLTSWPVCALPQAPGALSVVPRHGGGAAGDAGASDVPPYEIVAVLPGDRRNPAKVVTIDPRPFLRGAGVTSVLRDGREEALPVEGGAVLPPGSLAPCPITSAIELGGEDMLPASFREGAAWPNGIPYVEPARVNDLTCELPPRSATCGPPACCGTATPAPALDGGVDAGDAGAEPAVECAPSDRDAGEIPWQLGPVEEPRLVAAARDDLTLYVADEGVPVVHVVDLSTPGAPVERAPLLATSAADPSRVVSITSLAVSPATRTFAKFLYAVDGRTGSLMVFDVSAPSDTPRTPLSRPFPELNPFQPPDRVAFNAPVVAVTFARTDVPLAKRNGADVPAGLATTAALCNPNPNATDVGTSYRAGSTDPSVAFGPRRLRGVFAFVTLSTGTIAVLDVDDWDAPCRRPAQLTEADGTDVNVLPPFSSLAKAQPVPGPGDTDPYHAPIAAPESTSDEAFFPVSMPHRLRSAVLLRESTSTGNQVPHLAGAPAVDQKGLALPIAGANSETTPLLRPTIERGAETATRTGVRFSFEVPDVHVDQDWTVTYEGPLPGFDGLTGTLRTTTDYQTLELAQPTARFCAKGVEDAQAGVSRATAVESALRAAGRRLPGEVPRANPSDELRYDRLDRRMIDYVQLTDELLGPEDGYWSIDAAAAGSQCFAGTPPGRARYDQCLSAFGTAADESPGRDFPILEAYDDRLVLGRFFNFQSTPSATREVVYADPSNAEALRLAQCCFHGQTKFRVRGGAQWVAVGSQYGFLNHMVPAEGGRCVSSCDPQQALLNGRAPVVPRAPTADAPAPPRDSLLALRNPLFSFFVENGVRGAADALPLRDTQWRFATRGQFQSLSVNLASATASVSPQSMRFVGPLNQLAVVDAATQGLVLVDVRTVSIARAPFF